VLGAAKRLKAISKYGVGTDNIDMKRAEALGIPVSVTTGANADAVADYAFTLMTACARNLLQIDARCRRREWSKITSLDIWGKTLGILGLGMIGKGLARRAKGFGMQVLAHDLCWDAAYAEREGIAYAEPDEIYKVCDFISLHVPLTDASRHMIGDKQFAMMKPTAILINTARGGLVNEASLARALTNGTIYAAGVDAFAEEPPKNKALYGLPNLVMSSHCAASTQGAIENMGMAAARNMLSALESVVAERGYDNDWI
ncbi:MAG: phosphoglycerate dehydrogenase, partial [Clostridia bacterium]|nr:phosphoglycerate dehydrogenase [Clostridia bacterium]